MRAAALWPASGYARLQRAADGTLQVTDDFLRGVLGRPELSPVAESCDSERALHAALLDDPRRAVTPERLARLKDPDAQDNWRVFLRLRARLLEAGSVQAAYRRLFAPGGTVDIPPLFVDHLAQLIVCGLLDPGDDGDASDADLVADAYAARAAELFFRPQRITVQDGRVLAGDRDTLDLLRDTGGLGELGRLLAQARVPVKGEAVVLSPDDPAAAERYFAAAARDHHPVLLDLSHGLTQELGHGLQFRLKNARSGLPALARMIERWVAQLSGVQVRVEPVPRIDDPHWRWHLGLDIESSAILNDLYTDRAVGEDRLSRLVSLFRLSFEDPAEMHPDVAGRPVWLGLAHDAQGVLRMKPQNLLVNLPLARHD